MERSAGNWPDLTATDDVVIASSRWAMVIALLLAACAIGTFMNMRWGLLIATTTLIVLNVVLYWGHFVLFGTWDPKHLAINVSVSAVIYLLLRKGMG